MRRAMRAVFAAAVLAAGCGGDDEAAPLCKEPGDTCNDGLCWNGLASGVCDRDGECRTEASATGDCVVFLTKDTFDADFGGLQGADRTCQKRAEAAGLKGTFKAWLSDSANSASERLTHAGVPYIDTRGRIVANDWTDLTDGGLQRAMTIDETGYDWDGDAHHCGSWAWFAEVWTGTNTGGGADGPFCDDWTSTSKDSFVTTGYYCYASEAWTKPSSVEIRSSCNGQFSLYCIQQ